MALRTVLLLCMAAGAPAVMMKEASAPRELDTEAAGVTLDTVVDRVFDGVLEIAEAAETVVGKIAEHADEVEDLANDFVQDIGDIVEKEVVPVVADLVEEALPIVEDVAPVIEEVLDEVSKELDATDEEGEDAEMHAADLAHSAKGKGEAEMGEDSAKGKEEIEMDAARKFEAAKEEISSAIRQGSELAETVGQEAAFTEVVRAFHKEFAREYGREGVETMAMVGDLARMVKSGTREVQKQVSDVLEDFSETQRAKRDRVRKSLAADEAREEEEEKEEEDGEEEDAVGRAVQKGATVVSKFIKFLLGDDE